MSTTTLEILDGDPLTVRKAFAQFPSGVAVLAAEIDEVKHALVASSFMVGVSLEPCLVAVAVQRTSSTWGTISAAPAIGVSVFGAGQGELTRKLAGKDRSARFTDVAVETSPDGAVFVQNSALWFDARVHSVSDAGDHWMVLLEVVQLGVGTTDPLVWHDARFRELVTVR